LCKQATTTIDRKNSVDKDRELRKAIIGSLGRQPAEDKLTIYIKQDSDTPKEVPATVVVPPSPVMRRKFNSSNLDTDKNSTNSSTAAEDSPSSRLLSRYRHPVSPFS
jgi:hypothetical protein